jgi:hypothetical protein
MWVQHQVRGVVLTGRSSQSTADSLAILERHWARLQATIAERPGSGIIAVTTGRLPEGPLH